MQRPMYCLLVVLALAAAYAAGRQGTAPNSPAAPPPAPIVANGDARESSEPAGTGVRDYRETARLEHNAELEMKRLLLGPRPEAGVQPGPIDTTAQPWSSLVPVASTDRLGDSAVHSAITGVNAAAQAAVEQHGAVAKASVEARGKVEEALVKGLSEVLKAAAGAPPAGNEAGDSTQASRNAKPKKKDSKPKQNGGKKTPKVQT